MKEMHDNVPKGAVIEKEIIEETTDADGNEIIIIKSIDGEKGDMTWHHKRHPEHINSKNHNEFIMKMDDALSDLSEEERKMVHHQMRIMHHELSPEERKDFHDKIKEEDIDIQVDEKNREITIKSGNDIEVIKIDNIDGMQDRERKMIFITNNEDGEKMKKEIIIITRSVRIEDDKSLQNDLKGIKFNTYPNPNDGHFNIELKLDGKTKTYFKISDLTGKVIYNGEVPTHKKGVHTLPIIMEDFEKGTYLIQIIQGDKAATKRVIIE